MNFNWKRGLILLIPAAIIGIFLANSPAHRNFTCVPVIIAWIIYYIWGSLDKRKS